MRTITFLMLIAAMVILVSSSALATTVKYGLTDLGGGWWSYDYNVINDSLGTDLDSFSIFFDYVDHATASDLSVISVPSGWWADVYEPSAIDLAGYFDVYKDTSSIAAGGSQDGFQVKFKYTGSGAPGSQFFEIYDVTGAEKLDEGWTQSGASAVPEWDTLLLGLVGLAPVTHALRRRGRK